jgi:large repetitive protein
MNGRYERELTNGVHYIAIRASGNSNVRYRLRLSAGDIQDLALNGGALNNQILAAGDWRYYRVQIPTNAPRNWNVTFNQIVGDVVMYVRDTSPPGHGLHVTDYQDWQDDGKNHGPYPNYDAAGTHTILCPALRPGHTYFLGFRAVNDATFSVSSATSGGIIEHTNVVAFYGGVTNTTVAPNGVLRFRVDVPTDARRWIHYATNAATVRIYIDQGSCPTVTSQDHYSCQSVNCTLNRDLFTANNWPWHSGYMYFITITNTSASSQPFYFRMDGRNCLTDDNDNDMLPDCWELSYWVSIFSYGRNSDPDGDGVWNIDEYLNGSNPTLIDPVMLASPASLPNGHFQFWVLGPTNGHYRLQGSTAFATWGLVGQITNASGMTLVTDTNAASFGRRFYRAISP